MTSDTANVYRDGKIHVRATPCHNCLYSKDRLVSGERARQLTTDTRAEVGSTFICHRSQVSDEPETICASWFDNFGMEDPLLRWADSLEIIERVETDEQAG